MMMDKNNKTNNKEIFILGQPDSIAATAAIILSDIDKDYDIKGFVSCQKDYSIKNLFGKKVFGLADFIDGIKNEKVEVYNVLIIPENIEKDTLADLCDIFKSHHINIYSNDFYTIENQKPEFGSDVIPIESLLNRTPIMIENDEVRKNHYQKKILVTGGAGSIGREIVRQVALLQPLQVVVLDQSERLLYDTALELEELHGDVDFRFVLADISNYNRLKSLFEEYDFSIVYHAAAYKHVPLIEENPHEAVLVNILGTKNLALLSSINQVERFVMVSTDKAVNPTNVMGASKRVAELFVQSLQKSKDNKTKFITTRFGNVLGSSGSVIPHFQNQIKRGGPVTVTHPDIVRYFMTIAEACELVLHAGTMGNGGEIFVFDMGEPVKILDLARRMITLSGLVPDVDIPIVYTGLRPGEKLYEELLSDNTKTLPTSHDKIMISKDPTMDFDKIDRQINHLLDCTSHQNKNQIVKIIKEIVTEFISNNSIYESLDK